MSYVRIEYQNRRELVFFETDIVWTFENFLRNGKCLNTQLRTLREILHFLLDFSISCQSVPIWISWWPIWFENLRSDRNSNKRLTCIKICNRCMGKVWMLLSESGIRTKTIGIDYIWGSIISYIFRISDIIWYDRASTLSTDNQKIHHSKWGPTNFERAREKWRIVRSH